MDTLRRFLITALLSSGCLAVPALAADAKPSGLAFEKLRSEHRVKPADETVVASFKFTNTSGKTVKVEDVHTNCGCIRAETDKESYAPGESGTVEAEFKIGSFRGTVEKTVTVQTDLRSQRLTTMTVVLHIPTLVEITPDLTEWVVNSEPEAKEIVIKMKHDKPIRIVEVTSSRANFDHEVVAVEEGKLYKILITPRTTDRLALGVLRITTDCEIDKYKRQMAFFGVVKTKRNRS